MTGLGTTVVDNIYNFTISIQQNKRHYSRVVVGDNVSLSICTSIKY